MTVEIQIEDVADYLVTESRRALAAARRIPITAAKKGFEFLMEASPVYSGAYRACNAIGINELPEIDATVSSPDRTTFSTGGGGNRSANLRGGSELLVDISDSTRKFIAEHGSLLEPGGPWQDVAFLDKDFELGDEIVIGNQIRYADFIEEKEGLLITARMAQVVEVELNRGVDDFNRRSEAAVIGGGGDIAE